MKDHKDVKQQALKLLHTEGDKFSLRKLQQAEPAGGMIKYMALEIGPFSI